MRTHLDRLGSQISIIIPHDENGFIGRECPIAECEGYFKIKTGTGLTGPNLPCHCPYCGHQGEQGTFHTKEQVAYAKSSVKRQLLGAVHKDFKALEFNQPIRGAFGIGLSMKVNTSPLPPLRHYCEKKLETDVACDACTLQYTIYGVFGYCPDCGTHNSLQILNKNLELAEKVIGFAEAVETDMAAQLIGDALENVVAAFDGFGRETCRVHAAKATNPAKAESLSFQNLVGAKQRVQDLFACDLAAPFTPDEWDFACRCFQKRHLLAHKMGVVDDAYINTTHDTSAVLGRKVVIDAAEVSRLIAVIKRLGMALIAGV